MCIMTAGLIHLQIYWEFCIIIFPQMGHNIFFINHHNRLTDEPLLQIQNHIVERIWPEVNSRVNYPLKTALLQLVDQEEIYLNISLVRYCVSNLTGQLCQIGLTGLVESWNAHRIPGEIKQCCKDYNNHNKHS